MKHTSRGLLALTILSMTACVSTYEEKLVTSDNDNITVAANTSTSADQETTIADNKLAVADTKTSKKASDGKRVVCKRIRETGTRIPKKQCMTKAAWDRITESSQYAREKLNKPAYNRVNPK